MRRSYPWLLGLAVVMVGLGGVGGLGACSPAATSAAPGSSGAPGGEEAGPEGDPPGGDGGDVDPADGGTKDAAADSKPTPTPPVGDILGTLVSGSCGLLKPQVSAATPSLETNLLVFVAGETFDKASLSPGGQTLFDAPNAGGSSGESEVMSFEVLRYCEGASLVKTETQIGYQPPDSSGANSITDILVEIDGKKVGVSVTRAYKPPTQPAMTDAEIKSLLEKKLEGVNRSSVRVLPADKWVKQILHVLSVNKAATDAIGRVWPTISAALRADTIVLVTQTTGGGFVYCNPDPPLGTECQ